MKPAPKQESVMSDEELMCLGCGIALALDGSDLCEVCEDELSSSEVGDE